MEINCGIRKKKYKTFCRNIDLYCGRGQVHGWDHTHGFVQTILYVEPHKLPPFWRQNDKSREEKISARDDSCGAEWAVSCIPAADIMNTEHHNILIINTCSNCLLIPSWLAQHAHCQQCQCLHLPPPSHCDMSHVTLSRGVTTPHVTHRLLSHCWYWTQFSDMIIRLTLRAVSCISILIFLRVAQSGDKRSKIWRHNWISFYLLKSVISRSNPQLLKYYFVLILTM